MQEIVNDDGSKEYECMNEDTSLVSLFQETEEVAIFEASCIQELI